MRRVNPAAYGLLVWLVALLAACRPAPAAPLTPTPRTCADLVVLAAPLDFACLPQSAGILLQTTASAQARLTLADGTLTVQGTVYVLPNAAARTLAVMTLDGLGVVGARGQTRILQPGAQVILSLDAAGAISNLSALPLPLELAALEGVNLAALPRAILPPTPIAPPPGYTPPPTATFTPSPVPPTQFASGTLPPTPLPSPTACFPNPDWAPYTVVRGDTAARIAASYDLTVAELARANCLTDPDRLRVGQTLRVPGGATAIPASAPTLTPSAVAYRADQSTLAAGGCTVLRWDVYNVSAVFIQEAGAGFEELTTGSNVRQVCPASTTTYVLRVVYPDGSQSLHELTITVQ